MASRLLTQTRLKQWKKRREYQKQHVEPSVFISTNKWARTAQISATAARCAEDAATAAKTAFFGLTVSGILPASSEIVVRGKPKTSTSGRKYHPTVTVMGHADSSPQHFTDEKAVLPKHRSSQKQASRIERFRKREIAAMRAKSPGAVKYASTSSPRAKARRSISATPLPSRANSPRERQPRHGVMTRRTPAIPRTSADLKVPPSYRWALSMHPEKIGGIGPIAERRNEAIIDMEQYLRSTRSRCRNTQRILEHKKKLEMQKLKARKDLIAATAIQPTIKLLEGHQWDPAMQRGRGRGETSAASKRSEAIVPTKGQLLSTYIPPEVHGEKRQLALSELREIFEKLDNGNGKVKLARLRNLVTMSTLSAVNLRRWVQARGIKLDDKFFGRFETDRDGFITCKAFAGSLTDLQHMEDLASNPHTQMRSWSKPQIMQYWLELLRSPQQIAGTHIIRQDIRYGRQLGTVLMIPMDLLFVCNRMVNDDSKEFYSPYYAMDTNKDGLDTLSSLAVAAETEDFRVDGVFCIATNNELQTGVESLVTQREDLRMSAVRYHGVYRRNQDRKSDDECPEDEWQLYVRRAERLRTETAKGKAFSELHVVRVEAAAARSDQVTISRAMLGEGDVVAPPLRLTADDSNVILAKGNGAMMGESKDDLVREFPGNAFVHIPSGLLTKSVHKTPATAEDAVKEFVSVTTKKFFRFLPRRNGQRALT